MSGRRSIAWTASSPAGPLDITINRAKPEKDPRAIAAGEGEGPCPLCWSGTPCPAGCPTLEKAGQPAGHGVPHLLASGEPVHQVMLGGEEWAWWFSPYGYFPEHLIVASPKHRPMAIDHGTVTRLLDFSDVFPQWFIGSNADLPIVGGSILGHDHFQGGGYRFPLMKRPLERVFRIPGLAGVAAGTVDWPASVVRLQSRQREGLAEGACRLMDAWRTFSDEECGIVAFTEVPGATEPVRHNTVNPILWREDGTYVMDLVLRNNRTTPDHPYGLFHGPERLFHIKKENIGLIEIMGRAILPGRLAAELPGIRPECDRAFYEILKATGVFKRTGVGHAGWNRFIDSL